MRGDGGRGGSGEDSDAYKAQLAEVLSRWEAERATTADLQGRAAAAAAGLHGKVRASAEGVATVAQAELEAARAELERERRGRAEAEQGVHALRLEVCREVFLSALPRTMLASRLRFAVRGFLLAAVFLGDMDLGRVSPPVCCPSAHACREKKAFEIFKGGFFRQPPPRQGLAGAVVPLGRVP